MPEARVERDARRDWAIIVHGGAKDIAPDQQQAHRDGCIAALAAGQAILETGGSALDAVEGAVRALEDNPIFNAGYGSVRNAKGQVECDAAIMDGASLAVGGVAAVSTVRHPISVATAMLGETPVLLVGQGAEDFAREHGGEICDPAELIADRPSTVGYDPGCDTVGCVALDRQGNIAAGTSTGGLTGCHQGRVGDSPLPGCGLYAENDVGGVSLSGDGESLIRTTLAARVMRGLEASGPEAAIAAAFARLAKVGGEAGIIVIDGQGQVAWNHNSAQFAVAHARAGQPAKAFVNRGEDIQEDLA
jgi:isoaspartyl peptidase/L-asparaginase-like protein (Ntn-hydrolase superfamily)